MFNCGTTSCAIHFRDIEFYFFSCQWASLQFSGLMPFLRYNIPMRIEKCSSVTAFLILLFCFGGSGFMYSSGTQSVLVVNTLRFAQKSVEEQSSMTCEFDEAGYDLLRADSEIASQIEINELHNLPPPAAVV